MIFFNWSNPYSTPRLPVFARNIVSTSHPLAAQAGLRMLWKRGNAIDAAIAAAAAITVVEPVSNGLGSDCFALVWDGKKLHGLNSSGVAPVAWNLDYFKRKYGENKRHRHSAQACLGYRYGARRGCRLGRATREFGKLPFADLMAPAIEIAERGHAVAIIVQRKWAAAVPELRNQPGFADTFMPHGRAPDVSELMRLPGHAKTLRLLAEYGPRAYYEGEIAERIAACSRECGAAMTVDDLRKFRPDWVEPISKDYRGYTVHEIPPNGQASPRSSRSVCSTSSIWRRCSATASSLSICRSRQ